MNQTLFWSLAIVGLFIWLVFRPFATAPWKILGVLVFLIAVQPINVGVLRASQHAYPLKYDYVLQAIDQTLGLTAFQIARLFNPWQRTTLLAIYEFMADAMVVWYGVVLVIRGKESRKLLYSCLILFVVGGTLYGIVPAMGPRYAFGAAFPMGHPNFVPSTVLLDGYPNAMPSLHVATAFLLVLFAGRNRWLLTLSLLFLGGTIAATLAFEHYVIDLVVAIPFACFAVELASARVISASKYLGVVLAWLILIRFAWPVLLQYPWPLRSMALATTALGVHAVTRQWKQPTKANEAELDSVLVTADC